MKHPAFFIAILLPFLFSCSAPEIDRTENDDIFLQESIQGISWSLSLPAGPYAYTDRIPVQLSLKTTDTASISNGIPGQDFSLEPSLTVWGDFRVRRVAQSGTVFRVELIPRQTGECRISIPLYIGRTADSSADASVAGQPLFLLEPDLLLQVDSQLDEGETDTEPDGLLSEAETPLYGLWIALIAGVAAAGCVVFLIIRKRRLEAAAKAGAELQTLASFLEEKTNLEESEDIAGLYRLIFRLLISELDGLHPCLKGPGFGPAGLEAILEQPSALNQWNLRSIYPLLERMEDIFFAPDTVMPDENEYREHRTLLRGWLTLMEEDQIEV